MSPLPTFADTRGGGVSGMPTSAIFAEMPTDADVRGVAVKNC